MGKGCVVVFGVAAALSATCILVTAASAQAALNKQSLDRAISTARTLEAAVRHIQSELNRHEADVAGPYWMDPDWAAYGNSYPFAPGICDYSGPVLPPRPEKLHEYMGEVGANQGRLLNELAAMAPPEDAAGPVRADLDVLRDIFQRIGKECDSLGDLTQGPRLRSDQIESRLSESWMT